MTRRAAGDIGSWALSSEMYQPFCIVSGTRTPPVWRSAWHRQQPPPRAKKWQPLGAQKRPPPRAQQWLRRPPPRARTTRGCRPGWFRTRSRRCWPRRTTSWLSRPSTRSIGTTMGLCWLGLSRVRLVVQDPTTEGAVCAGPAAAAPADPAVAAEAAPQGADGEGLPPGVAQSLVQVLLASAYDWLASAAQHKEYRYHDGVLLVEQG
mmetsp:Transcript_12815/g.28466  ORF Transcript_12815/g.28466 Transcript_12815/m.28466 type:complete len:206 (+) Transcript_12815:497-1114(+)